MSGYLIHYGTLGQKWGKRNYQYEDGSLTPEGRIHYGVGAKRAKREIFKVATKSRFPGDIKAFVFKDFSEPIEPHSLEGIAERIDLKKDPEMLKIIANAKDKYSAYKESTDDLDRTFSKELNAFYNDKNVLNYIDEKAQFIFDELKQKYPEDFAISGDKEIWRDLCGQAVGDAIFDSSRYSFPKSIDKYNQVLKAGNDYYDACTIAGKQYMGKYEDKKVNTGMGLEYRYKDIVAEYIFQNSHPDNGEDSRLGHFWWSPGKNEVERTRLFRDHYGYRNYQNMADEYKMPDKYPFNKYD